jgi:serine/threonine protein kinase
MEYFDDYKAVMIGRGGSATVLAVNDLLVVKMFASGSRASKDLKRELKVYSHLRHGVKSPNIVGFYGRWEKGIVMERMEMTLRQRLALGEVNFDLEDQWIYEVATGLRSLHANGVIHGDFSCHNVLIGSQAHAKICDFAGSKLGHKKAWARYQVRNQHPKFVGYQPNTATDIFALGSVIYEITTGRPPLEHLPDSLVHERFQDGDFPLEAISRPEIRDIVEGCWREEYVRVSEICDDLASFKDT